LPGYRHQPRCQTEWCRSGPFPCDSRDTGRSLNGSGRTLQYIRRRSRWSCTPIESVRRLDDWGDRLFLV
jgi:hypothetical protein